MGLGGSILMVGFNRRSLPLVGLAALAGGVALYRNASERRRKRGAPASAVTVESVITIGKPPEELHELWREPETMSRIMAGFAEVTPMGEKGQHWEVPGPLGRTLTWDAETVEDRPGELLRWESLDGATVPNEGTVEFELAPGDRGTEVSLSFRFDPPGGALSTELLDRLSVVSDAFPTKVLRRFKSLAETGEIPTLERNPSARGSGDLL